MIIAEGRRVVFALICSIYAVSVYASPGAFENTAIVRAAELGGSIVHVTTTYAVKSLKDGQAMYRIALGADEKAKTSWIEGKVKGQKEPLKLKEHPFNSNKYEAPTLYPHRLRFLVEGTILLTSFCRDHLGKIRR